MKNIQKLGFMLIETLIVSTFITGTLLYVFIQFNQSYHHYNKTFNYNTINNLYNTLQIKNYIMDRDVYILEQKLNDDELAYIEISSCDDDLFGEPDYCENLFAALDVAKIYFTYNDLTKFYLLLDNNIDQDIMNFIDYISFKEGALGYRIIAKFNNDTFATLKIELD